MKKIFLYFLVITVFMYDFVYAKTREPLPGIPPQIVNVLTSPSTPKEDEDVKVTATIYNDPKKTDDTVISALLKYSIDDGNSWETIDMEQDEDDEKKWTATIPAQKEGTKVIFYISAIDIDGNIATEIPRDIKIDEKNNFIIDEKYLTLVVDDKEEKEVPENLDIKKIYFGQDKEHFYFKIILRGNIRTDTKGTDLDGFYCLDLWNAEKGEPENPMEVSHTFLYYRETATLFSLKNSAIVNTRGKGVPQEELRASDLFDVNIQKNIFYWRAKKGSIRDCPNNIMKISFWVGIGLSPSSSIIAKFWHRERVNYSNNAYIYFRNHEYVVK